MPSRNRGQAGKRREQNGNDLHDSSRTIGERMYIKGCLHPQMKLSIHQTKSISIDSKATIKMSIRQILHLTSLCTLVQAHGYLSQPMSRTGLNAKVKQRVFFLIYQLTSPGRPRYLSRMHHSRTCYCLARSRLSPGRSHRSMRLQRASQRRLQPAWCKLGQEASRHILSWPSCRRAVVR